MKQATYTLLSGEKLTVEYDETAPCIHCGLPVIEASVGGTAVCPWCDCGVYRDGSDMTFQELLRPEKLRARAQEVMARLLERRAPPHSHDAIVPKC